MSSLRAEPSPTISTINLVITLLSFLTTIPTLLPQPLPKSITTFLRFFHSVLLLSPIGLSIYTFSGLLSDPLTSLSTTSANQSLFNLLNLTATSSNSTVGVSRFVISPQSGDVDTSIIPHLTIVFMTFLAACVISFRRESVKRQASLIAFGISTAYVLGGLLTAFQPGSLDRDSSILKHSWLDEDFKLLGVVNETRFLGNFWISDVMTNDDGDVENRVRNVLNVDGFHDRFCETFNELPIQKDLVVDVVDEDGVPITRPPTTSAASTTKESTTSTTTGEEEEEEEEVEEDEETEEDEPVAGSEDDRPQASTRQTEELVITRNLLSQILVVYTVGKPLFTTYGKSISLLSLPFMTLTPVFIAYATRSTVLYPFIVGWVGLLLLLLVYATPETLRWVGVSFESSRLMTFCGRRYQVFVTDDVTYRIGVFDMVTFGFIVVTAILQGFRWMRVREQEDEGEVKMMGYDEVYSENGALRW